MAIIKKKKPTLPARAATPATPRREVPVVEPDEAEPTADSVEEIADLDARVQAFDAELQRVAAQARDEATKAADDRARQAAALKAKDFDGNEKLLQQGIQVLEAQLAEKNKRITELQADLREATVKVREIAVKAIEGTSGAAALTHVSGIALQQAKGRDDRS